MMRVVVADDARVGAGDEMGRRVEGTGQFIEGDGAVPFVCRVPARGGEEAMPPAPHWDPSDELVPDVSFDVSVDEVHRQRLPATQRVAEGVPVLGGREVVSGAQQTLAVQG